MNVLEVHINVITLKFVKTDKVSTVVSVLLDTT